MTDKRQHARSKTILTESLLSLILSLDKNTCKSQLQHNTTTLICSNYDMLQAPINHLRSSSLSLSLSLLDI